MKPFKFRGWTGCAALAACVWIVAGAAEAAYVITVQNQRVDGTDIRAKSDGEIILTTAQGTRSFFPGQYLKAVADKPPEIDKANQLVESKQYDEAVRLLEDVIVRFRFLDWDNQARAMLPKVYAKKGDAAGAIAAYEKLFVSSPKSKEDPELQWAYRQALLDAKLYSKLETTLDTVVAGGSRTDAARAQIMRGDAKASQGQLEAAVLDYLRTVIFFESEKDAQPEALFKTAETLKALRDPRAQEFYKKLIEQYPASTYAEKAKTAK
jgi:TolA-binding protein